MVESQHTHARMVHGSSFDAFDPCVFSALDFFRALVSGSHSGCLFASGVNQLDLTGR